MKEEPGEDGPDRRPATTPPPAVRSAPPALRVPPIVPRSPSMRTLPSAPSQDYAMILADGVESKHELDSAAFHDAMGRLRRGEMISIKLVREFGMSTASQASVPSTRRDELPADPVGRGLGRGAGRARKSFDFESFIESLDDFDPGGRNKYAIVPEGTRRALVQLGSLLRAAPPSVQQELARRWRVEHDPGPPRKPRAVSRDRIASGQVWRDEHPRSLSREMTVIRVNADHVLVKRKGRKPESIDREFFEERAERGQYVKLREPQR